MGLVREAAISFFFGTTAQADAFTAAWTLPVTIYDLLINGAISAALVPVFSEYAERDDQELWRIVSSMINVMLFVMTCVIGLMIWQAPLVTTLLVQETASNLRPLTMQLVQMLLPSLLFMGLAGLMTAVLFAQRSFLLPAFSAAVFNIGIILGVVLLHEPLGIVSLAVGVLFGSVTQVALQVWGLRRMRYQLRLELHHPAIRRMLWLYAPVALGVAFSVCGTLIDRRLASGFPGALAMMRYATTLIQFPLGLVAAAVSMAVLPTLSRMDANNEQQAFREMLGMGLKVVILLVLPAAMGLAAIAQPVTALVFEHGEFTAQDTMITAWALLLYLPSLPAAAIDQLLIFASYARKNTLMPNLVQGAAVGIYLVTALSLVSWTQLGFLGLVLGNSAQWIGHALLMAWLVHRAVSLRGLRLGEAFGKALLASVLMALAVYAVVSVALPLLLPGVSALVQIGIAAVLGAVVYGGLSMLLRVEALGFFMLALRQKLGRKAVER
ncbi:MAG: murein biosynthesis integral membrane protein MurJ [Chloroflexaceae bacterium]|nr:murein biosynthesis integral membrane protein MurJ [Chloroflexaceae bacterium]